MRRPRVRHHTNDAGLAGIMADSAIDFGRGLTDNQFGVHVEVQPFATTRPFRKGHSSPQADLGIVEDGAYVEVDMPADRPIVTCWCGPRDTAIIITKVPWFLSGCNAESVKLRGNGRQYRRR